MSRDGQVKDANADERQGWKEGLLESQLSKRQALKISRGSVAALGMRLLHLYWFRRSTDMIKGLAIGRMVHYVPPSGPMPIQAAIVASIKDADRGVVGLHVFPHGTSYFASEVSYFDPNGGEGPRNTWHWPEKV